MGHSRFAAALLLPALVFGCASREAVAPAQQQPQPKTQELPSEQPAPSAGASAPTSLDEGEDEGAPFATIEAAEAEFARLEREFEGLWAKAEKTEAKATDNIAPRCEKACKAFLSLERAATAICRLAGDSDSRCTNARKMLEKNRQRMADCACE